MDIVIKVGEVEVKFQELEFRSYELLVSTVTALIHEALQANLMLSNIEVDKLKRVNDQEIAKAKKQIDDVKAEVGAGVGAVVVEVVGDV